MSPDGTITAWVRQDFNIDPPDDHIYIRRQGHPVRVIKDLPPDGEWCRVIVWSPDSTKVGFVINDARLDIFDVTHDRWLAPVALVFDGYNEARRVQFSPDGRAILYDVVQRAVVRLTYRDGRVIEAPLSRLSDKSRSSIREEVVLGAARVEL
ncbi:MAG TPA: hypothetical protein VFO58_22005 [Vicinamibacterales bacterium]|nr:hypothetical protein [Vicinamibacterales bacterium]